MVATLAGATAQGCAPVVTGGAGVAFTDPATPGGTQPNGLTGWTLAMSEEFGDAITVTDAPNGLIRFRNGGPLWRAWYPDSAAFLAQTPGGAHTNNPGTELEYYDTSQVSLVGGALNLAAVQDSVHSGLPYTSGMIQCNPAFNPTYGVFEARLKVDGRAGSWPAWWMIPSSYEWPPEFDIMENFGSSTTYKMSNWYGATSVWDQSQATTCTSYHTYGLKWTSNSAVWYLDGTVVATETNIPGSIPTVPMYVVMNLAVRGTDYTSYSMQVDYIRCWQ